MDSSARTVPTIGACDMLMSRIDKGPTRGRRRANLQTVSVVHGRLLCA